MTLNELVGSLPGHRLFGCAQTLIKGMAEHSQKVKKGDLFFCVRGVKDNGRRYVADALRRGAVALLTESKESAFSEIPQVLVPQVRFALAKVADTFYASPSTRLKLIGVTGTNGKTTVT